MSFQGNSCLNAFLPSPQHVWLCAFILKGIKSSKQALTLLLMHERFWTSVKNLPSSKAASLCLAEEVIGCPQLGHIARRVCMPELIAHGLPCKCPGYPRITYTSKWERVGACWCATSELEERNGGCVGT